MDIPSGCTVYYYDHLLVVSTSLGIPVPAGETGWYDGTNVSASVAEPDPGDSGVRYVCTGWTGTGSVPASGTGTNVTFAITEDSTLTWNWKTQVLVSVSVTGGTGEPESQWADFGGTAAVELHPAPGFPVWSVSLSGDADGAAVSGTTLSVPADRPREVAVAIAERKLALTVSSERGTPAPARGTSFWTWGDVVSASVTAPPEANGWQFVCTGWSGTGSVPASGTIPSVAFLIEEDSSIAWNWTTNVWIECAVTGDATSAGLAAWRAKGSAAAVVPFAAAGAPISWTIAGDADGVAVNPDGGRITIPSDRPRSIAVAVTHHTTTNSVETGEPVSWSGVGAAAGWRLAPDETAVDGWSLRSGEIESGETASVEIALPHAGTLSFDWRVSSAVRKHFACCYVDGTRKARITGETDWATETVALGDGPHVVRWTYEKSSAAATGDDAAFLDNVRWAPLTLADALDAEGIEWSTEGGAAWVPQVSVSSDGEDAAKSGSLVGEETSRLVATVAGPGTLSWLWKTDVEDLAGVDVYLDGAMLDEPYLMDEPDWTAASLRIDGEGTHRLEFRFWNGGTESTIGDCAYIDCVEWNSDYVIVEGVVIPKDWIRTNAADVLAAANGNFAAAASATAANGRDKVWECYVAGVDPSDPASRFLATIGFDENGEPDVKWTPDLGGDREYVVDAKRDLDGEWGGMDADSRFFRVRVAMPGGFGAYTITFDTDGGSAVAPIAAAYGAALAAPADPEKLGHDFAGWLPAFPATMPAYDLTLMAQWAPKNYTIAFDADGGSDVVAITAACGSALTAPENPTKDGYDFAGWSPPLPAAMPASNLMVVAQWTPKNYTIAFDTDDGSSVAPITAAYGSAVTAPENPTKDGYDFAGWIPSFPETMPLGGETLVAQWTPKNYTIAFDTDDGSAVAPITAAYGSAVTAPENPTKDGYDFAGWLPAFPETMPLGGETLVAQWTPKNYTITFDTDGGSTVAPITAAYGAALTAPANPTKDGCTFAGWSPEFPATMPLGGLAVVARWRSGDSLADALNPLLTFTKGGNADWFAESEDTHDGFSAARSGAITDSQNTWIETTVNGAGTVSFWWKVSSESGYDYLRFTVDGSEKTNNSGTGGDWSQKSFAVSGNGSHTLRWTYSKDGSVNSGSDCGWLDEVVWRPDVYALHFDANGGTGGMDDMEGVASGASVTLPVCEFSRNGWTFLGWARSVDGAIEWTDGATVEDGFSVLASGGVATLFARWSQGTYAVRFEANGGTGTMPEATLWCDVPQALPRNTFEKEGFLFGGWATNEADEAVFADGSVVLDLATAGATATLWATWSERSLDADWFVDATIGNDANDGRSWNAAFATIQAAVDASAAGDKILVADGVYAPIRTENKTIEIRSEHGPANCIIDGGGTNRCAKLNKEGKDHLSDGNQSTRLVGFTLRNGRVANEAAGAYGGTLVGCILCDNHVTSRNSGGGARAAILENCLVLRNSAVNGGGCVDCRVVNCTFAGNSASECGNGCYDCHVFNSAFVGQSSGACGTYEHNINATASDFIDAANGDYRLSAGSSCIDEGDSSKVAETTDLTGNPRIVGAAVDVGCYERQP